MTDLPQNIVSLSGGKDSTAMLLMMLEKKVPIHSAVFFDTGWEFPEMHTHLDKLEKYSGVKIHRLRPERSFNYWMYERRVVARKGKYKGQVYRIGNGWPSPSRRWCTRQKVSAIDRYQKSIPDSVSFIGYASDESHRISQSRSMKRRLKNNRFPLIEWGISEEQALSYCYDHGFHWNGLYRIFSRVSCFCCPLQRISELKKLRKHYPHLWAEMLKMDASIPSRNRGFKDYRTVHDFELRFRDDDRQLSLFGDAA